MSAAPTLSAARTLAALLEWAEGGSPARQLTAQLGAAPLVLGGRFEVAVEWSSPSAAGVGVPQALTADTGLFWFFAPENLEVVVKVLDACALNERFWVFGGGLTDVAARVTISDTQTGVVREYVNAQGVPFQPIRDTSAFPCS